MSMHRRRKDLLRQESEHTERWLVSYADYMTLMFALFVVLYAFSLLHDDKSRVVTKKLEEVFQTQEKKVQAQHKADDGILPGQVKDPVIPLGGKGLLEDSGPSLEVGEETLSTLPKRHLGTPLEAVEQGLEQALLALIKKKEVKLERNDDWLTIDLASSMLFPSGSATATRAAREILAQIADIIRPMNNYVRVRGYTDNQPIHNELFSNNWELSAMRATALVVELEKLNVKPERLAIEGYGQYSPFADNSTPEGRAQNRKVVIAISRFGLKSATQDKAEQAKELAPSQQ